MAAAWLVLAALGVACGETSRSSGSHPPSIATAGQASPGGATSTAGAGTGALATAGLGGSASLAWASSGAASDGGERSAGGTSASGGSLEAQAGAAGVGGEAGGGVQATPILQEDNWEWAHWPMPDVTNPAAASPSYDTTTTPGVVHDNVTALDWQRAATAGEMSWLKARQLCSELRLAGFSDWRLPTRVELMSIVDYTRYAPSIDVVAFPSAASTLYFTDTQLVAPGSTTGVVYVNFDMGSASAFDPLGEGAEASARCVRAELRPQAGQQVTRYLASTGSVVDVGSGLEWERSFVGDANALYLLDAALAHCKSARSGGHADWRLASLKEMSTLLDSRYVGPALDPLAFPMALATQWFLVSTPFVPQAYYPPSEPQNWAFNTTAGFVGPFTQRFDFPARCVRSSGQ